jgi:putative membrane protein
MTIPITLFTAYIILAILGIGNEIENPFGTEVNDLPMEMYCTQITSEVNLIASTSASKLVEQFRDRSTKPLFPISTATADFWEGCSQGEIREALKMRASVSKGTMWERQQSMASDDDTVFEPSDEEKGTKQRKKSFWFAGAGVGVGSDSAAWPSVSYD